MKKILSIILLILFILKYEKLYYVVTLSINIWKNNLLPILFPSLILSDFLLSSKLLIDIFKNNYIYIYFISLLSGTPTNAKNLLMIKDNITNKELNIILSTVIMFNPLFVIRFTSIKIYIIITLSNTLLVLFNYKKIKSKNINIDYKFDINNSINNNFNILINILATIMFFMILTTLLNFKYISGLLEITTGLSIIKYSKYKDIFYLLFLSYGGLSILIQIKSILKDTFIDYKLYFKNRTLCFTISILIYFMLKILK